MIPKAKAGFAGGGVGFAATLDVKVFLLLVNAVVAVVDVVVIVAVKVVVVAVKGIVVAVAVKVVDSVIVDVAVKGLFLD